MIDTLHDQKAALIAYLLSKVAAGDWHAVQDAASDIREINAKLSLAADIGAGRVHVPMFYIPEQ